MVGIYLLTLKQVAAFYGPVWLIILITFGIYIICGKVIFQKRKMLREFSSTHDSEAPYPLQTTNWESKVTKEVHITSEPAAFTSDHSSPSSLKMNGNVDDATQPAKGYNPYSVTIEIGGKDQWADLRSPAIVSPGMPHNNPSPYQYPDPTRKARLDANKAAFGYARVSLLFFLAILVTWVCLACLIVPSEW